MGAVSHEIEKNWFVAQMQLTVILKVELYERTVTNYKRGNDMRGDVDRK